MHSVTRSQVITLDIQNLYKSFAYKKVHQGITLQLFQGEILGLLGGSGTGKSVLIRSIIGLERPDSGKIIFKNQNLVEMSEIALFKVRTQIGYVFQNGALFDSLTVEENLAYPLQEHTLLSKSEIQNKVNHMLEMIDMPYSHHLLPNELSGGMQKRAGFARAIILNPEIILFDEPTAGLDPMNTKRLLENIKKFKNQGMTGIFVTHDIPSVFEIADRVAILYEGKIYIHETIENLKKSQDPIVKSFLNNK